MATPSKGIMKPVMRSEVVRMQELAREGHSVREISRRTGRCKNLVLKHVKGLLVRSPPGGRMLAVLELVEQSNRPLGVLACDLGYANGNSLGVMLNAARRLRAFKNGERASWR